MEPEAPSDVVFFFSIYSVILWLVALALLAVLYFHARPIHALARSGEAGTARRVCARSAFFLAAFSLSPVMASVLGLPLGLALLFVPAFLALGIILKRSAIYWPVVVFFGLVAVQVFLDLSFFVAASEHAEAFAGLADLLLFRGHAELENMIHVFFLLPADAALLFHIAKTVLGLSALIPAILALREGKNG